MATKITDNYFEFGVHKYFRGNAHLIEIGTYGEKKDPIGSKSYIDPQSKVVRQHLVGIVTKGSPVSVDWAQTTNAALQVNGGMRVFGLNLGLKTNYTRDMAKTANLKIYNLSIAEGPLQKMLNTDADGARTYLAEEGSDGRIVSEIWVVMEAELSEHFNTSGGVTVSVKDINLDVTASGGKHGTQTITLSAGTTFAFKSHKVKDWSNGKTRIENMEADYHS
jgi:hypothetical protein